jgi:acetyltransferase-like isoleucine patch superfamily enzyme
LPGVTIGDHARIAAGAVVRESVTPGEIVIGNPSQVVAFVAEDDTSR